MLNNLLPFNFILACDSYKLTHFQQLNPIIKRLYSVIVPRKPSKYATEIVAVGQTFVAEMLANIRIDQDMIDEAEIEANEQGYDFNRAGWEIIVREMDGRLPIEVYAVEEGRVVQPQTPIMGIVNTDERFAWLVSYVETWVQDAVWIMSSVASLCRAMAITVKKYMEISGADMSTLFYKVHNFGDRGAGSPDEGAVLTGIGHAVIFNGSDCTRANRYIKKLYNTSKPTTSSIDATEHSVMCSHSDAAAKDDWGAAVMAVEQLKRAVKRTKEKGVGIPLASVVMDTYDARRFGREYLGTRLKDEIINSGGKLIGRPDSGDVLVEPSLVADDFAATFGLVEPTKTGHKMLHPAIGVIQGDSIKAHTLDAILEAFVVKNNYSMDNLTTGCGGGITNYCERDDFSFSMKAVAYFDGNHWVRMLKEPKTDSGKKSLSGLVRCRENADGKLEVFDALATGGEYLFRQTGPGWRLFAKDGYREYRQTWDNVRERAREGIL